MLRSISEFVGGRLRGAKKNAWRTGWLRLGVLGLGLRLGLGLGLGVSVPGDTYAFGDRDRLQIGQIVYGSSGANPTPRQQALQRMMWELDKRTSIETDSAKGATPVRLSDKTALFRHPFLYMAGDHEFAPPSEDEITRLRRHLLLGGMLLIDSAEGRAGGGFDQSVRAFTAKLFPKSPLKRLSEDHVIYRSFYLLRVPVGRVVVAPYLEAVTSPQDGRVLIVYSQNDLGGAWARDLQQGQWQYDVVPGGEGQREQAIRLGVNLAMYALCLDYKADQVHVPFIMRRRAWQAPPPVSLPR